MENLIRQHLLQAQQRMKSQADKKRSERTFQIGEMVYLKLQPYVQASLAPRANMKFSFKFFGPYKIIDKIGATAYKLQLPTSASIHPVFHVSLLKKVVSSTTQVTVDLPNELVAFQVPEELLQYHEKTGNNAVTEVLVKWSGMPRSLATWEKLEHLKQQFPNAPALVHAGSFGGGGVSTATSAAHLDNEGQAEGVSGPHKSSRPKKTNVRVTGPE
jgi:hypothetical protein